MSSTLTQAQTGPGGVGNADGSGGQPENLIWLDASYLSSFSDGDTWFDKSGNGYNAQYDGSATTAPAWSNNIIGGKPALQFDGSNDYLRILDDNTDANRLDSKSTVSIISVFNSGTTTPRAIISKRGSSSGNTRSWSLFTNESSFKLYGYAGSRTVKGGNVRETSVGSVIGSYVADGNLKLFVNGSKVDDGKSNGTVNDLDHNVTIGRFDESDGRYFNGDIAEILVYSDALNEAQRVVVENYLSAKYGIALSTSDYYAGDLNGYNRQVLGIGQFAGTVHTKASSGGLVLNTLGTLLNTDNEFVMAGHKTAINVITTSEVTGSVQQRWERTWYVDKTTTNTLGATIGFDFSDGISGEFPQETSNYVLLRYDGTNFVEVNIANSDKFTTDDQIFFRVTDANLTDGIYTLGTTNPANSPLEGKPGKTWYSYNNGDWKDPNIWTLDGAAFPRFENPDNKIPGPGDNVIITAGNKVNIQPDNNNITVRSIEVVGNLDVTTSSGHDFTIISGSGNIHMAGSLGQDNFPAGEASNFADPTNGGTVILYGNGLNLNQTRTFNHLRVALSSSATEATLLKDYTLNGNLFVETGTFKVNDNTETSSLSMNVYGDVTVDNAGFIRVGNANARHQMNLYGDLINDGNIAFTNRTAVNYTSEANNGVVDANFLNDSKNQLIACNGSTRFYRIEIDKGISATYELHITASQPSHFALLGYANQGHPQNAQLTNNSNALGLVRGTVRIGTNVEILRLNGNGNYNVSAGAQLWVDGGYVAKTSGTAIVLYGKAKVSKGSLDALVNSGFTLRDNGTIEITGGELNAYQIRTSVLGAGSLGGYVQTGGTANLLGTNVNGDYYVFNLTYPGNVFTMKGGTLNIKRSRGKGGIFINSAPENIEVTEGEVNLELGTNEDMRITSRAPFYNLNLRNTSNGTGKIILDQGVDVSSTNENLAAQPLVVLNNLNIENNTHFKTNGKDVTVGRNFTIGDNALYEFENNTTIFNSNRNATLSIGDITSVTNPSYVDPEAGNPYTNWELPLHHVVINKPGATLTLFAKNAGSTGSNADIKTPAGGKNVFRNKSNLVKVTGDFALEAGTVDIAKYSLRLYGSNITNKGTLGLYTDGTSPTDAIVKLRKSGNDFTITTTNTASFGNLRINSGDSKVTFVGNAYAKRLEYRHGRVYLGTHNLKVDILDINLEAGETQTDGTARIFSTEDMFITAGNASDGGLSIRVPNSLPTTVRAYNEYTVNDNDTYNDVYNQPDELWFPIGTEANGVARYTPAVVKLSNVTDDGYITVSPVDDMLNTTNINGGNLLSYYWKINHYDFTNLPVVTYYFSYDDHDLNGEDESSWVAGKVLDESPFTRSGEDFEDSNGNGTLETGEGTADIISVNESDNMIVFDGASSSGFSLERANYTCGEVNRFTGKVEVYYSRKAYSNYSNGAPRWDRADSWAIESHDGPQATDYPKEGDIAVIGGSNGNRRPITIKAGTSVEVAETVINRIAGDVRLYVENTATANLGVVKGNSTIQLYVTETNTPSILGDFGEFTSNHEDGSRFLFFGNGGTTITLPNSPSIYPNVRIEGNGDRTFLFPVEVVVKGRMIVDNQATFRVASDLLIEGNLRLGLFKQGKLLFPDDLAKTLTVKRNLSTRVSSGGGNSAISVDNTTENGLEHRLIVEGDIQHRNGTIDLFSNNTGGNNVILELAGNRSNRFYKTVGNDPELYRVIVNKGINQDSTFTFEDEFTLQGTTDTDIKALELQNGTLILDDEDINIDLTTGGANFIIPITTALDVKNGTVNVSGDDTGILLAGTLRISGPNAKVDMNNTGNGNNYIEYSVGNPTLEISEGTLTVGSQIRRVLNDANGALTYVQTGGDVTIGRKSNGVPSRGMLEVVNGGKFVHTGGSINIVSSNNSASVAALHLAPSDYDTDGSFIKLGDGNSLNGQVYGIKSSIPLYDLTVSNLNNRSPEALLFELPLTVDNTLTITNGSTLNAGSSGLALTLNGDLINDGSYLPNGNITTFNSGATQTISGSAITEFYDVDKTNSGTLALDQSILITHDLQLLDGVVADDGNTIEVRGDVTHDALHTSSGGEGIVLAGATQQQLKRSISGNSTLGVLTVRNANGVVIPESNGFNFTVTEQLRLDAGVFNIGSSALILEENATIEAVNAFGFSNMVRTNSSFADAGLRKVFAAGTADNFIFPVGEDVYSPVTVDFAEPGASVGTSRGEIAVVPNRKYHPVINDGVEDTRLTDLDNVLQYYWAVRTDGISNFTGNLLFNYDQSDVALGTDTGGDPYLESEYIPARILTLGGNTSVDKFTPTLINTLSNTITFEFSANNNSQIYGDYFAGIDPAIPDEIPVFTSTGNSNAYDDPTAWTINPASTPFPVGGPQGSSIIVIKNGHTIDFNRDGIEVYKTIIEAGATVDLNITIKHDLGIVTGQGTIDTETGTLPAGLYKDFFTCSGGKINYSGTGNYSVFKGGISQLREVTFSGATGERTMPSMTSIDICENVIINGPRVINPSGNGTENITVGNDFLIQAGTYETGNNTLTVNRNMLVQGIYQGQNGHQSTVNGNLAITSGTFNAGNNSVITVGGNLDYNTSGNFTSGSSRIVMQGSSAQTITGTFTGSADMNRLEIDNGAGVALAGDMHIDTELILKNGTLTPNGNKLLLDTDATVGPNDIGSATSFVNGTLCKIITNSEEFVFPVGKDNRWGYASVDPDTPDTHEWCVEYYNEIATNNAEIDNLNPSPTALLRTKPIRTISGNEYWRIEDNASGIPAIIGLMWDGKSDVSMTSNDWYELEVMEWNTANTPSAWDAHGGIGHDSNPSPSQAHGFFKATSLISFSKKYVTLGSSNENNALPVELVTFQAEAQEKAILLTWETASEINNDFFEVQRSIDGQAFEKIGEVAGQGSSNEAHHYQFIDKQPLEGTVYYRLKQVDYDGIYDYSDLVAVEWTYSETTKVAPIAEVLMFPNPSEGGAFTLRIRGMQHNSVVSIKLIDMVGKVHLQQLTEVESLVGSGLRLSPNGSLPAGLYFVNIQQGNTTFQKKLIVR